MSNLDYKIINFWDYLPTWANVIALVLGIIGGVLAYFAIFNEPTISQTQRELMSVILGFVGYISCSFGIIRAHNEKARKNIADREKEK